MKKRYALPLIAAVLGLPGSANAHHPEIVAVPGCIQNAQASVFVTATAWDTDDPTHRVNDAIEIEMRVGDTWAILGGGRFTEQNPSFTLALTLPANEAPVSAVLRARARLAWGPNQEFGSAGETRETSVLVTEQCRRPDVDLRTTTTSVTTASVTSTTVPVEAAVAVPVVAQPRFTG